MSAARQDKIRAELEALEAKAHAELKTQYQCLTGDAPPKRIGRTLLKLAVAYEIQRNEHKTLTERVHRKLTKLGEANDISAALKKPKCQMKPGGRLLREWHGKTYEVYVAGDGVYMDGKRYKSLSAVARTITCMKLRTLADSLFYTEWTGQEKIRLAFLAPDIAK